MGTINDDAFCLKWNDYQKSVASSFAELRHDKVLSDVTVVCEGVHLPAHRVILSACSGAFKELFQGSRSSKLSKDPIVMMWDVKSADMEALFNFMYEGQVNVSQDRLNTFLGLAERLQVKGLTNNENNTEEGDGAPPPPPPMRKRPSITPRPLSKKPKTDEDNSIDNSEGKRSSTSGGNSGEASKSTDMITVKQESRMVDDDKGNLEIGDDTFNDSTNYHDNYYDEDVGEDPSNEAFGGEDPMQGSSSGGPEFAQNPDATKGGINNSENNVCTYCGKTFVSNGNMRRHVEDIHEPTIVPCGECGLIFKSKNQLSNHRTRAHRFNKK